MAFSVVEKPNSLVVLNGLGLAVHLLGEPAIDALREHFLREAALQSSDDLSVAVLARNLLKLLERVAEIEKQPKDGIARLSERVQHIENTLGRLSEVLG